MALRVPPELRIDFVRLCELQGSSASAEIRKFMEERVAKASDKVSDWFSAGNAMNQRHASEKQGLVDKQHALEAKHAAEARKAESLDIIQQIEVDRRHSQERRELDAEIEATLERQDREKFVHKHQRALAA